MDDLATDPATADSLPMEHWLPAKDDPTHHDWLTSQKLNSTVHTGAFLEIPMRFITVNAQFFNHLKTSGLILYRSC